MGHVRPIRWWQCVHRSVYIVVGLCLAVLTADLAAFEGNFVLVPKIDVLAGVV